jgi:hypothetical protein
VTISNNHETAPTRRRRRHKDDVVIYWSDDDVFVAEVAELRRSEDQLLALTLRKTVRARVVIGMRSHSCG